MQRHPIRPPDLNGSFLTAIKRACREARGRPIRRLRRLPRLWACSRPPSRRPRPPRRWIRPPGRAERGFGGSVRCFAWALVGLRAGPSGATQVPGNECEGGVPICAGRTVRPAKKIVSRGPHVGEQGKRLFSSTSLLMTRQQIAHPAPPMGPWADPDHLRTCSVLGKYSWQSGTASTAAEEDRSMCR